MNTWSLNVIVLKGFTVIKSFLCFKKEKSLDKRVKIKGM
jgi:hypothetical protein